MFRLLHLVSVFVLLSGGVLGQKGILLFEEGEDYLTSDIESSVRNLYNSSKDEYLFNAVVSRKALIGHLNYETKIDKLLQQYSYGEYSVNEEVVTTRENISKFLSAPDFIMLINVKPFQQSIGVEFNLFQQDLILGSIADSLDYGRLLTAFDRTYYKKGAETFFVNLEKNNHLQLIEQALSRLFPESRELPEIEILVNENIFLKGDKATISIGDTIVLDAAFSRGGSKKYSLSYEWTQVYPEGMSAVEKRGYGVVFSREKPIVKINPIKPGEYYFIVKVEDGVNRALSDTVTIEVVSPLKLECRPRGKTFDLFLWNPGVRKAGGRLINYEFLDAENYSLGRNSRFSASFQEVVNIDKKYLDAEIKSIRDWEEDSIMINDDLFYIKNAGDSIIVKEVYSSPLVGEDVKGLGRENVMSLFYEGYEIDRFDFIRNFRVHTPIQIGGKNNFLSVSFSSKTDEAVDSFSRNLNFTTTELDLVLSRSVRASVFGTNKEFVFRDKLYEDVFLDTFQVSVSVPYYQSLEISGARLSYSWPLFRQFRLESTIGLTRYRYLDGALSEDEISIFQVAAGQEDTAPGNEVEIERLIGLSRLVNIFAEGDSNNFSSTSYVLGAGIEITTPIANWPVYLNAGCYLDGGSKKLPFNRTRTFHFGVNLDLLAFFHWHNMPWSKRLN